MTKMEIIFETTPVHVLHETYRRECRYHRGNHVPLDDLLAILDCMNTEAKIYFDFHNPRKELKVGTYLNGHSGLARHMYEFYQQEEDVEITQLLDGKDFYVKIV